MRRYLLSLLLAACSLTSGLAAEPLELLKKMDGFRKEIPPAKTLSEMNGFSLEDISGKSFTMTHLAGVAERMGATSKADCLVLLTYLDDKDAKLRFMAAHALEKILGCYPGGMSLSDILEVDSDGHRELVRRFVKKLAQPGEGTARPGIDVVAVGGWSEPVLGVRGRLVITLGRLLGDGKARESTIYLELQEIADAVGHPKEIYFDPAHERLKCELTDAEGKVIAPQGFPRSGGNPAACWITLPYNSTISLAVSPYAFGRRPEDGLMLPLIRDQWVIPSGESRLLGGTFQVQAPQGHGREHVWEGTLTLPKMKVLAP